ncbi:heparinase II/III family protein [Bartonella raoultii]|uniref:Heparinase II/III family protein n=1 Tax=Bartonella raoultii TaxID=1457020 RepID=A0ABS7I588_9HYPH|nr:heparinase II/III family protein [Bartonella raoultii]MBX4335940.1 heparinase II/III family protein [Bartonella raoultii]
MNGDEIVAVAVNGSQAKAEAFVYTMHQLIRRLSIGPLFHWRFSGFRPHKILAHPIDLHLTDPKVVHEFYHGRFAFAGYTVHAGADSPFSLLPPTSEWEAALHDFHWLRHMTAAESDLAAAHARALLEDWLDHNGKKVKGLAWSSDVVARRLISWICHSRMLLEGASERFEKRFLRALGLQFRYLRITISSMEHNAQRLQAAIALTLASLALPVSASMKKKVQTFLIEELSCQILVDGGHISRSPLILLNLLADLLSLRHLFVHSSETAPRILIDSVERMLPALRFFIHEDQTLAHFNGVGPLVSQQLLALLELDETVGHPFSYARYSGFQRLKANQTTVLADTGKFPPHFAAEHACSGCLSFEMSSQGKRFIINIGVDPYGHEEYRHFGRVTAAHSTATVNDCSVGAFHKKKNGTSLLLGGPTDVKVHRIEDAEKTGFIARHNGYVRHFNLIHERGLILATNGAVIEGFDRFFMPNEGRLNRHRISQMEKNNVAIRFHLHPQVEVNYDGNCVRLTVEGEQVWSFISPDTDICLEDSIDFAEPTGPQRTQQIVLYFRPAFQEKVRWRFVRHSVKQ